MEERGKIWISKSVHLFLIGLRKKIRHWNTAIMLFASIVGKRCLWILELIFVRIVVQKL